MSSTTTSTEPTPSTTEPSADGPTPWVPTGARLWFTPAQLRRMQACGFELGDQAISEWLVSTIARTRRILLVEQGDESAAPEGWDYDIACEDFGRWKQAAVEALLARVKD